MNFLAPAETPVQTSRRGPSLLLVLLVLFTSASSVRAQVGGDNPTGVSGIFNGNLENTGVDPWTGNATRSITDISVAGAVGEYPLALVRTANSRAPSTTEVFSWSGGWNHNYNWILEDSPNGNTQNFQPSSYTIEFPDGRVETFKSVGWDAAGYYRVRANNGGSAGVRERLVPINPPNNMVAKLILPDGGKVEFQATQHSANGHYYYKYKATAIVDPHGLRTTFQYEVVNNRRRLTKVTEPAGRYLQFSYIGNGPKISQVTASDGRSVNYYYACCNNWALDHVVYYNNANWTAHYQYTNSNIGDPDNNPPLLKACDDPMYAGPMKRIAYEYRTSDNPDGSHPVYGQVYRVRYWDGISAPGSGTVVSTLTVGMPNNNRVYRTETRGDGATRVFIYNGAGAGYLSWASDFTDRYASQTYDSYKYVNSVTDRNGNRTDYTLNPLTGNVTVLTHPLTQGDTPGQQTRPTLRYQYGCAGCADTNNRDGNNPYYLCTVTDEGGHVTQFNRDANKRAVSIVYPDGGWESFTYNGYGQVLTHRMTTGGTETFAYDGLYRLQSYSDAYHNNANNPNIQYFYERHGWVNGVFVFDPVGHPTNWTYNDRGQVLVTTLPPDPFDNNTRNTITNAYNPDGTLQGRTNELEYTTSYTYDDYRRLKSVYLPGRGTTNFYYGANPSNNVNDYKLTDSNVTWLVRPSGKKTRNVYDDNRRKSSVTVGSGSGDDATTSYTYDWVGNLRTITNPLNHNNVSTLYDERNRPYSTSVGGQTTTITYDTAGRQKTITHPNGQVITNYSFDVMNRVLQQNVTQTPDPTAVTKYTYYAPGEGPVGLLHTMQDPRLVATNSTEKYEYTYDAMGRKAWAIYPKDSYNQNGSEHFTYDDAGRLETFKNRAGNVQTFTYDALNRMTRAEWNDGTTPRVDFAYDAASRLTGINNANAQIARIYWGDGLLLAEAEFITGGASKVVQYHYDADGNRASITYPEQEYIFDYTYTGRNQLKAVGPWATYDYDTRGNLTKRTLINGTHTDYAYDGLDRVTWVTHSFGRWFNYGYYDNSNNRKYTRRWNGQAVVGEVFGYDFADQVSGVRLNIPDPGPTPPAPSRSIYYDANGNRTTFSAYGPTDTYYLNNNNLNQYNKRNNINADYDYDGNLTTGFDGSTYEYDAQNRLTRATKGSVTMDFKYDGLNRQVSRSVTGQPTVYNVWDGWDLIEEYHAANQGATTALYLYGATGLILGAANGQINYYYQDGSGSTSDITDGDANLQEWYRYDLQGTPFIYDANNNQLSASALSVRHLFTGQQWYQEIGLYDLRNRFYSPDIGRFLQPDPIGFRGDRTNLYRYAGNNPVTYGDPTGEYPVYKATGGYWYYIVNPGYRSLYGSFVPGSRGWCAWGAQILSGAPDTKYWVRGAPLGPGTPIGTVVAMRWVGGRYPGAWMSPDEFRQQYGDPLYHTGIYLGFRDGQAIILDQYKLDEKRSKPLGETPQSPDGWYEVNVPKDKGLHASEGATGQGGAYGGLTPYLASRYNPYYGYLSTSPTVNFAGGIAMPGGWHSPAGGPNFGVYTPTGGSIQGSIFGTGNWYSGLDPNAAFGHIYEGNPTGAGEGGRVPKEWR